MQEQALAVARAFFLPLGDGMREAAVEFSDDELARTAAVVRRFTEAVTAAARAGSGDGRRPGRG